MKLTAIASLLLVFLLVVPPPLHAEEDSFDALDRMLEENFDQIDLSLEEQYKKLDEAMEDAYQRLSTEIKFAWGEDEVRLPSKKEWVDYSDDLSVRRTIDFEHGVIRLERLVMSGDSADKIVADMEHAAAEVRTDTPADLSAHDLAMRYAREELQSAGVDISKAPAATGETPVLAEVDQLVPAPGKVADLVANALETSEATKPAASESGEKVSASVAPLEGGKRKVALEIPFSAGYRDRLAARYQQSVLREARKQKVKPSLLFAVMETESSFNPRATSAVPAFGLMQLVPSSGAMDAYNFVYGEKTLLDPEYLYQPEKNVELGAAYLNILLNRYLRPITNLESRRYCAIAAYNTGAGNVARAFTGRTNVREAANTINAMAPQQVFEELKQRLPYDETRRYVDKVTRAQQKYLGFDQPFGT